AHQGRKGTFVVMRGKAVQQLTITDRLGHFSIDQAVKVTQERATLWVCHDGNSPLEFLLFYTAGRRAKGPLICKKELPRCSFCSLSGAQAWAAHNAKGT